MATAVRTTSADLGTQTLRAHKQYWAGEPFECVRQLIHKKPVRFRVNPNTNFPTHGIAYYRQWPTHYEINVNFMGLVGHHGVLPNHYQTTLSHALHSKNAAFSDFLDIFQHRLIDMYYHCWTYPRPMLTYRLDINHKTGSQAFDQLMCGISGFVTPQRLPTRFLFRYAGILLRRPLPASIIQNILSDYLRLPLTILTFQGKWLPLTQRDRSRISNKHINNQLGRDFLLGNHMRHCQHRCLIKIGSLNRHDFESLLPSSLMSRALIQLAKLLIPPSIEIHIRLSLKAKSVPLLTLNKKSAHRLGLNTWIGNNEFVRDADDVVYNADTRMPCHT